MDQPDLGPSEGRRADSGGRSLSWLLMEARRTQQRCRTQLPVDGVIRTYGLFEKSEWRKDIGQKENTGRRGCGWRGKQGIKDFGTLSDWKLRGHNVDMHELCSGGGRKRIDQKEGAVANASVNNYVRGQTGHEVTQWCKLQMRWLSKRPTLLGGNN